jgi:tRNA nucleotidyltransferase (CCA-adding enzyme)
MEWFRDRARALAVTVRPPEPILRGRDLLALGMAPGPGMGRVLKEVYERQLDGAISTLGDAIALARTLDVGDPARVNEEGGEPQGPPPSGTSANDD